MAFADAIVAITLDISCFGVYKLPTFEETLDCFFSTFLAAIFAGESSGGRVSVFNPQPFKI